MKRSLVLFAVLVGVALLATMSSGCVVVKPYQREQLSERVMTPGAEAAEDRFRQHWRAAREGATGGFGTAGGGCGCN